MRASPTVGLDVKGTSAGNRMVLQDRAAGTSPIDPDSPLARATEAMDAGGITEADQIELARDARAKAQRDQAEHAQANQVEQQLRARVLSMVLDLGKAAGYGSDDLAQVIVIIDTYARNGPVAVDSLVYGSARRASRMTK
jgi:hypothetical protein